VPRLLLAAWVALMVVAAVAVSAASDHRGGGSPSFDAASERFTVVFVPDTQYLLDDDRGDSEAVTDAFDWIVSHRASENIAFAASLGDVTEHGLPDEMRRADDAYRILDRGRVPYSVVAGNHDVDSRTDDRRGDSPYLQTFGPRRYARDPTFGGASPGGYNTYHVFRAAGREWLVLGIDWRISDAGLDWAQGVLDAHPRTPTILTTHELVTADSRQAQLSDYGQRLWDRLIRRNDQIFLTLNGHYWPVGGMTRKNDFGHDVQLNLANYQDQYYGGAGMIRTYAFDLARNTIDVSTFSPWVMDTPPDRRSPLARRMIEKTGPTDRFSLPVDFATRFGEQPEPPATPTSALRVPGTVALWRPQTTPSGAVADASGNGNDLTPVTLEGGGSLQVSDDHGPDAPSKTSLRFDGGKNPPSGTYLRTAEGAPLNRMTFRRGYTIEAFFKLPPGCCDANAWMGLLGQLGTGRDAGKTENDPDEGIVTLALSGAAELQWAVWPLNRGDNTTSWGHLLESERWTHVALVNDGRFTDMYVDGSLVARNPFTPAIGLSSTGKPWMLGASNYANVVEQTFNGWVGDVRIVDRALPPSRFMSARGPRLGVEVEEAELERRAVEIELEGRADGTLTAAVAVPWTGLRLELGSRPIRSTVRFPLSEADYRALTQARPDGARVELTLGGERVMVHLDAR
jgi:hypothetical protein